VERFGAKSAFEKLALIAPEKESPLRDGDVFQASYAQSDY